MIARQEPGDIVGIKFQGGHTGCHADVPEGEKRLQDVVARGGTPRSGSGREPDPPFAPGLPAGAAETSEAIISALRGMRVRTLTYDNGMELSRHLEAAAALDAEGCFCNPYSSWVKGGVENFNGLVRQHYPKGTSFKDITPNGLQQVENSLNSRPRKTLNFASPVEHITKIAA